MGGEVFPPVTPQTEWQCLSLLWARLKSVVYSLRVSRSFGSSRISNSTLLCKLLLFPVGSHCALWSPLCWEKHFSAVSSWVDIFIEQQEQTAFCIFFHTVARVLVSSIFASLLHTDTHMYTPQTKCLFPLTHCREHQSWMERKLNATFHDSKGKVRIIFSFLAPLCQEDLRLPSIAVSWFYEVILNLFKSRLKVNAFNINHVEIISSFAYAIPTLLSSTKHCHGSWPLCSIFGIFTAWKLCKHPETGAPCHHLTYWSASLYCCTPRVAVWHVTPDCTLKPFSWASDVAQFSNNKKAVPFFTVNFSLMY